MGCLIKVTGIFTCLNLPRVCNFSVAVDDRRDYILVLAITWIVNDFLKRIETLRMG